MMKTHLKQLVLFLLIWLTLLNSCTSWNTITVMPDETAPTDVKLILKDLRILELKDAFRRDDAIVGKETDSPYKQVVVPLSDISKIEEKERDNLGPAGILVAGSLVIIGVAMIVAASKLE